MRPVCPPVGLYFIPNLLQLKPLQQPRDFVLILPSGREAPAAIGRGAICSHDERGRRLWHGEASRRGGRRPMDRLLRAALGRLIRAGNLRVRTAAGSSFTFGDGTGTPAAIRFTTRAAERGILLDPALRFGEAYMDGGIVVEEGSIADVLAIVLGQPREGGLPAWARLRRLVRYLHRRVKQFNPRPRARRNAAHHYDL